MTEIKAPKHLSAASARWFREVADDYEIEGDQVRVLQIACESFDLAQEAREALAAEGIIIEGPTGARKANPAVPILNAAADRFLKAVAMLGLRSDDVPLAIPGQRQHIRSVK